MNILSVVTIHCLSDVPKLNTASFEVLSSGWGYELIIHTNSGKKKPEPLVFEKFKKLIHVHGKKLWTKGWAPVYSGDPTSMDTFV